MKTIHHVVEIAAPPGRIFAALTTTEGLSGWWTTKVSAHAEIGAVVDFTFGGDFNPDMRVTELDPPGLVELMVFVESSTSETSQPRTGMANWVEAQAGQNGNEQVRYPLRGSVIRYEQPTEPVAEADWEALR